MTSSIRTINEHLQVALAHYAERTFVATLLSSPQMHFSPEALLQWIEEETEYWMAALSEAKDGKTFLQTFEGLQQVFDALKHEEEALEAVRKAVQLHGEGNWADASLFYLQAISNLHFGMFDWSRAAHAIADETPFDPYHTTQEEREKRKARGREVSEPSRASYADMQRVSPQLLRLYQNLDRVFCIGQEADSLRVPWHYRTAGACHAESLKGEC